MDAHLRRDCRRGDRHGILRVPASSSSDDEVAVIAKVTDLAQFKALKGVKRVVAIAGPTDKEPDTLVTARVCGSESEIELLRKQDCVLTMKAPRRVKPFLELSKREIMSCDTTDNSLRTSGGKGVIVGIVDFGLDFAHRNFRSVDGSTRVLALWDQKAPDSGRGPEPFRYGRLFETREINEALANEDPYKALGYSVPKDSLSDTGAHGTYVADVAAGNGAGTGCPGVAPEADIVFVDVATGGPHLPGPQPVGSNFGDSVQLLEAIKFIFDYAQDRPCVVNISLGTNGGPHDGSSPVETAIDRLVREKPNRSVVIAAGNSMGRSLHATGQVRQKGFVDLKWRIPRFDATSNELEVWYSGEDRFTVDVLNPAGRRVARVKPGWTWEMGAGGSGSMTVVNRECDPNNGDNTINVFFERGVADGNWTLRLRGDSVRDGRFHAWIERDERGQSRFVRPTDGSYVISNNCTLSSLACGVESIVVGSYDAREADRPLSETSSAGPTRDERTQQQPTVSAPGENVLAAHSGTLVLRHRQSGTSIAAAAVTGTVALMLSEADRALAAHEIRGTLIGTAHGERLAGREWDPGYGYGLVCANEAVTAVQASRSRGEVVAPLSARHRT
jgi:subtilisin family serine protease